MTIFKAVLATGLAAVTACPAAAADPYRLAYSEKMGVEAFAQPDAAGTWCRPAMTLSLMLKDGSPLLQGGVAGFVAKLGPVFDTECPAAAEAAVTVYKASDKSQVGTSLSARKTGDRWIAAETAAAATPPAPAPVAPAPVVPPLRDQAAKADYPALLTLYAKSFPAAADDKKFLALYASQTDCENYAKVAENEFKLGGFLTDQAAQLLSRTAAQPPYVRLLFNARFGEYDAAAAMFDFAPLNERWSDSVSPGYYPCSPPNGDGLPRMIGLKWQDAGVIGGLPMPSGQAEAFLSKRMEHAGHNARNVVLEVIAAPVFSPAANGRAGAALTVVEATVFADRDLTQPLHVYNREQLAESARRAASAAAEAARRKEEAEEQRKRDQAVAMAKMQADADRRWLQEADKGARIAYLHDGGRSLSQSGRAIALGLIIRGSQPVRFLIQASGSGTKDVETGWPSRLRLDLADGLPELRKGAWYVVSGEMTAEQPKSDKPAIGRVAVRSVTECRKEACGEAADDIEGLVQRRLSAVEAR